MQASSGWVRTDRWILIGLVVAAVMLAAAVMPRAAAAQGVTVEGPFFDLAGQTIDGTESYDVTVCYDGGVAHVGLEEVGVGYVWEFFIPPLLRAQSSSSCNGWSWYVDTTLLSEGTHTFRGAVNQADEVSDTFTVTIDR